MSTQLSSPKNVTGLALHRSTVARSSPGNQRRYANSRLARRPAAARVGIVGTGFIATGLFTLMRSFSDMAVTRVMTRRDVLSVRGMDAGVLTSSLDDLLEHSDIIVECSGDIIHTTHVVDAAMNAGIPVVTMGAEFHVTVGSWFGNRGILTEAEGDQPGSLAAMHEEAVGMGFRPLVYGNIKGFLNHHPEDADMEYWARRNGISRTQVTSFTDGTKLQIEQALVANGLNAAVAQRGLIGLANSSLDDSAAVLGARAREVGGPISDYLLNPSLPAGVFIVAEHPSASPEVLRYLKLGNGPDYTLLRPYHLCHLEMPRTIRRVLSGQGALLNNGERPHATVVAVAKKDMPAGTLIEHAIGGSELRGEAASIFSEPDAPAIGILNGARLRHSVLRGQTLRLSDVDIPDSLAKTAWHAVRERLLVPA